MKSLIRVALIGGSLLAACGDDGGSATGDDGIDIPVDADASCDPATVLPASYRPVATTATTAVMLTTTAGVTSGSIDATAGGLSAAADNPYIYVDLVGMKKVDVNDLTARQSLAWDVALKRSSLRTNGGDSGGGGRTLAVVEGATIANVTAPSTGYTEDDFTSDDCMYAMIPGGEPLSAFGEWYAYDSETHAVTPKMDVYVVQRPDKSRTAFRIVSYYGDDAMPMRGAFYKVEAKQLSDAP